MALSAILFLLAVRLLTCEDVPTPGHGMGVGPATFRLWEGPE